jgi:serine/threonine protein phosphatase 1
MTVDRQKAITKGRLIEIPAQPLFVVGDVHGCYHTYRKLIEDHWNPEKETLIQLGDLLNRGRHSSLCLDFSLELQEKYPDRTYFLLGNHEYHLLSYLRGKPKYKWVRQGSAQVLKELSKEPDRYAQFIKWIIDRPLAIETPNVFVSHAGWSRNAVSPFKRSVRQSLIHNRAALKNLGKMQVIGHIPSKDGKVIFKEKANAWQIDSSACLGYSLSGIHISPKAKVKEIVQLPTNPMDVV